MLGNCAMGSPDIATRPMTTMRMEITMATMGRLMKNLAMVSYSFLVAGAGDGFFSDGGEVPGRTEDRPRPASG